MPSHAMPSSPSHGQRSARLGYFRLPQKSNPLTTARGERACWHRPTLPSTISVALAEKIIVLPIPPWSSMSRGSGGIFAAHLAGLVIADFCG